MLAACRRQSPVFVSGKAHFARRNVCFAARGPRCAQQTPSFESSLVDIRHLQSARDPSSRSPVRQRKRVRCWRRMGVCWRQTMVCWRHAGGMLAACWRHAGGKALFLPVAKRILREETGALPHGDPGVRSKRRVLSPAWWIIATSTTLATRAANPWGASADACVNGGLLAACWRHAGGKPWNEPPTFPLELQHCAHKCPGSSSRPELMHRMHKNLPEIGL